MEREGEEIEEGAEEEEEEEEEKRAKQEPDLAFWGRRGRVLSCSLFSEKKSFKELNFSELIRERDMGGGEVE